MIAVCIIYCIIYFNVFVDMQLLYIYGVWNSWIFVWNQNRKIGRFEMLISKDTSNRSAVLCMCFQTAVYPRPIGRVISET